MDAWDLLVLRLSVPCMLSGEDALLAERILTPGPIFPYREPIPETASPELATYLKFMSAPNASNPCDVQRAAEVLERARVAMEDPTTELRVPARHVLTREGIAGLFYRDSVASTAALRAEPELATLVGAWAGIVRLFREAASTHLGVHAEWIPSPASASQASFEERLEHRVVQLLGEAPSPPDSGLSEKALTAQMDRLFRALAAAGLRHHPDERDAIDAAGMSQEQVAHALETVWLCADVSDWPKQEVAWCILSEHATARAAEIEDNAWTEFLRTKRPWYRHLRRKYVDR